MRLLRQSFGFNKNIVKRIFNNNTTAATTTVTATVTATTTTTTNYSTTTTAKSSSRKNQKNVVVVVHQHQGGLFVLNNFHYHHHHHHHHDDLLRVMMKRCYAASRSTTTSGDDTTTTDDTSSSGGGGNSSSSSSSTNKAFDRNLKLLQRNNAARARKAWRRPSSSPSLPSPSPSSSPSLTSSAGVNDDDNVDIDDDNEQQHSPPVDYEYFRQEMAVRLVDRLDDIRRDDGFPLALEIGAGAGHVYRAICSDDGFEYDDDSDDDHDDNDHDDDDQETQDKRSATGGIGGVRKMVLLDSSDGMLHVDDDDDDGNIPVEGSHRCDAYKLVADEESKLPFPDGTFDIVLSSQALHWINDLPQLFREVHRVLKPDGCFMFSMIGGTTLPELRISLSLAELERDGGGGGAHVGPFVELSDVGSLMQNAGFALPTIDVDTVRISYPNAAVLMEHLQRMGEGNASLRRRQDFTGTDVFLAASCIYDELYPIEDEEDGRDSNNSNNNNKYSRDVEASVQVIFAIGWTPHASQQKPSKRGSATHTVGEMVVTQTKSSSSDSS